MASRASTADSEDDATTSVRPSSTSQWPARLRLTKNESGDIGITSLPDVADMQAYDTPQPDTATYHDYMRVNTAAGANLGGAESPPMSMEAVQASLDTAESVASSPAAQTGGAVQSRRRTAPVVSELLRNNRKWATRMERANPQFFPTLAKMQTPLILWIGCSDSRVPANMIIDLAPGEVFVHRNVANIVTHTDFNALSVLQYAVEVLKVQHVIVCGHYGCGGVAASVESDQFGLIDNWLRHLKDVYSQHRNKLENILHNKTPVALPPMDSATGHQSETPTANITEPWRNNAAANAPVTQTEKAAAKQRMLDLLCELNVARSLQNVCHTTIVQNAWSRGQNLTVHGWCYRLNDGIIRDLEFSVSSVKEIAKIYQMIEDKCAPKV